MERISCVQLRGNTYYFRQRLPHDIALMLGRVEIVRSLKTSSFDIAIARKRIVSAALESTLDLLRDIEPKDTETARDLFRRWFEGRLEKDFRQRQRPARPVDPPYPSTDLEKRQWIVDKPLGRTLLQSEARLIASVGGLLRR